MSSIDSHAGRLSAIIAMLAVGVMLVSVFLTILRVGPAGIAYSSLFNFSGDPSQSTGRPAPTQYVTRLVRVRSAPTADSSTILRTLGRGTAVDGAWVTGTDGKTSWLRVSETNGAAGFIWSKNLAPQPRPLLESAADKDFTALQPTVIRSEPAADSTVLDTVSAGATLHSVGTIAGGVFEVALLRGGVGYVSNEAVPPAAAASIGTAASFNCASASTWDERLICSDQALGAADRRLAALYANAMSSADSDQSRGQLRTTQRGWIRQRKTCERSQDQLGCMRNFYQERAGVLGSSASLF